MGPDELRREALEWATTRGSRSGHAAWQYIQDLAGRLGRRLEGSTQNETGRTPVGPSRLVPDPAGGRVAELIEG